MDREDTQLKRPQRKPFTPNRGVNDYGYVNTRIHAMRGELLKRETLLSMTKAGSLEALSGMLGQTVYAQDIKAAEQKYAKTMHLIDAMDDALKQNCARCINHIRDFSAGRPRGLIDSMFMRWDAYNIVTIFRGKHGKLPAEEIIQNMFLMGSLSRQYLEELAQESDIPAVVEAIAADQPLLYRALKKAANDYTSTGNLVDLELIVDKWYYHEAIHKSQVKLITDYLRSSVDIRNLVTAMRFVQAKIWQDAEHTEIANADEDKAATKKRKKEKKETEKLAKRGILRFFVPGGRQLSLHKFKEIIKFDTVEDILKTVRLSCGDVLYSKLDFYQRLNEVGVFERVLEAGLLRTLRRNVVQDPLSFDLTLYFLQAKYNEFINLRLMLRVVEFGIPESVFMEELIAI